LPYSDDPFSSPFENRAGGPDWPGFFQSGQEYAFGGLGAGGCRALCRTSTLKNIDVAMFVASAYEKPNLVKAMPAIAFTTLVGKVSNGHVPFKPKRLTKW
jgi:hypothetical protein